MSSGSAAAVSTIGAPTAFNSEWAGAEAESYISLADAHAFITTRVVAASAWTDATTVARISALVEAARDIDSRQFIGRRYNYAQKLEMPRELPLQYPFARSSSNSITYSIEHARMKERVEQATCHQALWILRNSGRNMHMERVASGVKSASERAGDTAEAYEYRGGLERLSHESVALLRPYLEGRRVYRG